MKRCVLVLSMLLAFASWVHAERYVNGVWVPTTIEELVDPERTAIIVVDMQNEICSTQGGYWREDRSAEADPEKHEVLPQYRDQVENLSKFLERAREMGILVTYAEYIHRAKTGKMVVNGPEYWTHRNADWVSCAVEGTWGAETIKELAPKQGEIVVRKARSNTFYQTYLDDALKERGIRNVLMTGTAGAGCVFATAMGALERGYFAVYVKDCVDQPQYQESDLIKGRFPMHEAESIVAVWDQLKKAGDGDKARTKNGSAQKEPAAANAEAKKN